MMNDPFNTYRKIHLVGIKGVAMTALAQCFLDLGKRVTGSDVAEDFITAGILNKLDIQVKQSFHGDHLDDHPDVVVFTGAHGGSRNVEVVEARKRGIPTMSHAEALGVLIQQKKTISVCGVGGKSTSSAMLAWILSSAGKNPGFSVGVGEINGLGRTGTYTDAELFVAEADEYAIDPGTDMRPRFTFQTPFGVICSNIEHDHPDVYSGMKDTVDAYLAFFSSVKDGGFLVLHNSGEVMKDVAEKMRSRYVQDGKHISILMVGSQDGVNVQYSDYVSVQGNTTATITYNGSSYKLVLKLPGEFNLRNACGAFTAAVQLGVEPETCLTALSTFSGTSRRFEDKGEKKGIKYYDDYAHHPKELQATLKALREWYPSRKIVAVFQPHTYSRTKELLKEFSRSFHDADLVLILEVFPSAREQPDPTVSGKSLAEAIRSQGKGICTYIGTVSEAKNRIPSLVQPGDVVITLGAGDLYHLHDAW